MGNNVPNGAIAQGQVWTVSQWNTAWLSKVDASGGVLDAFTLGSTTPGSGAFTTLSASGMSALAGGGSFGGNFTGTLNLTSTGTALAVSNNASVAGQLALNAAGTRYFTYNATDGALEYYAGSNQLLKIADTGDLYFNTGDADLHLGGTGIAANWYANTFYGGQGNTWTAHTGAQTTNDYTLYVNGNLDGTTDQTWNFSEIVVNADTVQSPGVDGGVNWINIVGNVDAGFTGKRAALASTLAIVGSNGSVPDDNSRQWQAGIFTTQISANQGGTAPTSGSSAGFVYGGGDQCWAYSGATSLSGVVGREVDVAIYTGASAAERVGLQIISFGNVQGHDVDMGLRFAAVDTGGSSYGPGFKTVIGLQANCVDSAGALMQYQETLGLAGLGLVDAPPKAALGIDLSAYDFSTGAFRAAGGFLVAGTGAVSVGPAKLSTSGATTSLDVSGSQVSGVAVSNEGGEYVAGDQLYDPTTGTIVTVSSVDTSGHITGLSLTVAGAVTGSTPANPVALLGGTGGGATATLTWTATTALSVNPSGAAILMTHLPTSSAGLATGQLWNNAGTLSIA